MLRLAALLGAVALAGTRLGLLAHELVGHGGVALACGGHITAVKLFWFGGGWIRYTLDDRSQAAAIAVSAAGIAVELLLALALWLGVRGDSLGRQIVRGLGAALVVHATWYLAVGTFHGFGDGATFYRALGAARIPVAVAAGCGTCVATFLGARAIVAPLACTLPRNRVAGVALAALLGGGVHATLTIAELRLRRDPTYATMMRTERDRRIAVQLERWEQARGSGGDPEATRVERARLEQTDRPFPFAVLLALATVLALIAGIAKTRGGREEPIGSRLLAVACLAAVLSIAVVIALDRVLPG